MAQQSGFFNALLNDGVYDRVYNANDYSDNLAVVISDGVLRSTNDDLKVTATNMVAYVNVGRAWIKGHYYNNTTRIMFNATTAPVGGNRWDRVVLRFNNTMNERRIYLVYITGTVASTPTKPSLTRTTDIYDLCLADIYVTAGATTLNITDTRGDSSVCGWVYSTSGDNSFFTNLDANFNTWFTATKNTLSSVTLFKRYNWRTVVNATTSSVSFNIPQYDANTCFIEVYVNGILETLTTDYTVSGTVITFSGTLTSGTEVEVKAYKSIDGTGIQSVSDEITQLQNQYATLSGVSKFTYTCTGLNDNIALSQIANAILNGSYTVGSLSASAEAFLTALGGNNFLASLPSDAQVTINVVGTLGATTPFAGSGTTESRYRWFALGNTTTSEKKIVFDFAKCSKINIACSTNTNNIIFFGTDIYLKNANVYASCTNNGCIITMIAGSHNRGKVNVDDCRFKIVTTGAATISQHGNFNGCTIQIKSTTDNAYIFDVKNDSMVTLGGGIYYAYTGTTSKKSAIINVESTEANAAILANNIVAPTVAQEGYYQNYLVQGKAGMTYIYGVCTTLVSGGSSSYRQINGYINVNKR